MPKLVILTGKNRGMKLTLPQRDVVVGREPGCDITLATHEISRRHCLLKIAGESLTVQDLGSRNGTWLNDVRIEKETRIGQGDILRIGPMLFRAEVRAPVPTGTDEVPVKEHSEDSVVNWLIEDDQKDSSGDSTIISKAPDTATIDKPPTVEISTVTPAPPSRKQFHSIAEEAQDIIRRHREMKIALQGHQPE